MMLAQFSTIGHSNRSLDEFLAMLRGAQVDILIDVRSFPRSRKNPFFNIDSLPDDLAHEQIGYRHCSALGGCVGGISGGSMKISTLFGAFGVFTITPIMP